ncbi:hypothetical protein [Segatella buccae]
MKIFITVLVTSSIIAWGCSKKSQQTILGEYVYYDATKTLHSRRDCITLTLRGIQENNGDSITNGELPSGVVRIPTKEVEMDFLTWCCPKCIDDSLFKELELYAKQNL